MNEQTICMQENCAMRNTRLLNKCDALKEAYEYGEICPFFKSEEQYDDERMKRANRIKNDKEFRKLVEYYASQGSNKNY